MPSAKNNIISILSRKSISVCIVLLAIGARIVQLVFFFNIRVDGMYQYLAMKYFVNGHGISIAEVLPSDLSQPVYEPLINWPPGYSILLSPFYILSGHHYVAAGLTLDILAATALIIFTRKILRLLDTPVYLVNIYTIFSGFFIYNFYLIASSDAVAISLFIIALYQSLLLLKTNKKWLIRTAFISLLLILCGFIKYLFLPVVFAIPVFFIFKGYLDKNLILKKAGLISFLLTGACLASLLFYQAAVSGAAAYISQQERGFFPENLYKAYPFIPAALLNPETITRVISPLKNAETPIFRFYQLIHIISVIGIIIYTVQWTRRKRFRQLNLTQSFFLLSILAGLLITGLLFILSVSVAQEENNPGVFWTYIEDARYHGLVTVVFQLSLFCIIHRCWQPGTTRWKFIPVLILLAMLPETCRGIIFTVNRIRKINTEEYSWQAELKFQKYADAIIQRNQSKFNTHKTVVSGSSYYMNYRVCLYSHAFYMKEANLGLPSGSLKTSEDILLLVITEEEKMKNYSALPAEIKIQNEGSMNGLYFYSAILKAQK